MQHRGCEVPGLTSLLERERQALCYCNDHDQQALVLALGTPKMLLELLWLQLRLIIPTHQDVSIFSTLVRLPCVAVTFWCRKPVFRRIRSMNYCSERDPSRFQNVVVLSWCPGNSSARYHGQICPLTTCVRPSINRE